MKSLMSQINEPVTRKPFQQYTVSHGIEHFEVLIPLHNCKVFEEDFSKLDQPSKTQITQLAITHGGKRL